MVAGKESKKKELYICNTYLQKKYTTKEQMKGMSRTIQPKITFILNIQINGTKI